MAVVEELIRKEEDGTLSFGNYELAAKSKRSDFEYEGDIYKIKTCAEITKLEKNGMFVYESVPGTTVTNMSCKEEGIKFFVEGKEDAQVTIELEPEKEYDVSINGNSSGVMKTNLGGKLSASVELNVGQPVAISVMAK